MELICFFVSFLSSAVGAICGIGGVVIKPVLDFVQMGSAGMINFLSGCTVLSMSLYSVGKAMLNRDGKVNLAIGTPLALGATLGGVAGKKLFAMVNAFFPNGAMVGGVQAAILALITVGTLLYTVAKSKITTRQFRAWRWACCLASSPVSWASAAVPSIWWCWDTASVWTAKPQRSSACISSCSVSWQVCLLH